MKCQSLFSGKNKKNINLLSAEFAYSMVLTFNRLLNLKYVHSNDSA